MVVTADAVEGKRFDGVITSIGIIGTSSSGVTTYPVEVVIEEYEGLLPGMNVTAEIITEEVTDTVRIPVAALSRGDLVLVTQEYAQQIGAQQAQEEGAAASVSYTHLSSGMSLTHWRRRRKSSALVRPTGLT